MIREINFYKGAEFAHNMETSIKIPGIPFKKKEEIVSVRFNLIEGDLETFYNNPSVGKVKSEIIEFDKSPEFLKQMAEKGARVFVTEKDHLLVMHSKDSLKLSEEIQKPVEQEIKVLGRGIKVRTEFRPFLGNVAQTQFSVEGKKENWINTYWNNASMGGVIAEFDQNKVIQNIIESITDRALNPPKPCGHEIFV
jgi:hypothetical protein